MPGARRVLMILYEFPPLGGIGMSRNVRNVQYLPRSWLDARRDHSAGREHHPGRCGQPAAGAGRRRDRPDEARRASRSASRCRADQGGVRSCPPRGGCARARAGCSVAIAGRAGGTASLDEEALDRHASPDLALRIRRFLLFPDEAVGWVPFAIAGALAARRRIPCDVIFSTSHPVSSHLAAGVVKRLTGLPWVAELRDPWLGNRLTESVYGARPWLHRRLQFKIERWIARTADQLVCVTPSLARMYQRRYPGATVVTIPNGYDRSEVPETGCSAGCVRAIPDRVHRHARPTRGAPPLPRGRSSAPSTDGPIWLTRSRSRSTVS